jgi:hypothetical protein
MKLDNFGKKITNVALVIADPFSQKIWGGVAILELLPFFHQIFKILILFILYFKNYKR